ncbi:hypothetical protein [Micromonospora fulviviridis]|uniref:Uncharacterized protein n=1 Tax=Micromonospora fulviviridis TaxID=47860 RepID=A0ABV2VLM3_9ACTN
MGFGLPTVIAGFLVVHGGGLRRTAEEYAVAVILVALLGLRRTRPESATRPAR